MLLLGTELTLRGKVGFTLLGGLLCGGEFPEGRTLWLNMGPTLALLLLDLPMLLHSATATIQGRTQLPPAPLIKGAARLVRAVVQNDPYAFLWGQLWAQALQGKPLGGLRSHAQSLLLVRRTCGGQMDPVDLGHAP